jgi:nucleotide-binding universal stress UspA family protein
MFEKLLLLLDGSELDEVATTYIRNLAGQLAEELYLLYICPTRRQSSLHISQIYLDSLAEGLRQEIKLIRPEFKVQSEIIVGKAANIIFRYAKLKSIDLIVLATWDTSRFWPWSAHRVQDKVFQGPDIPTLIIQVKDEKPVLKRVAWIQRILLPLDGSEAGKIAIPFAVQLSKRLQAGVTLFSMVGTVYSRYLEVIEGDINSSFNWNRLVVGVNYFCRITTITFAGLSLSVCGRSLYPRRVAGPLQCGNWGR